MQLCVQVVITTLVAFWLADPRSFWGLGSFMITGGFCLFILKTHEETHPFFVDLMWPRFWLYSAPVWCLVIQFTAGLGQSPLGSVEIGNETYATFQAVQIWRPTSTARETTWITLLGFCALYLTALNLYIVPKSRAFFEKVLPWLCLSAVIVAIVGYLQAGFDLQAPLFTKGTGQTDFFSFFPYDGHWAAFALIWAGVCTSLALLSSRFDDSPDFVNSISPWYLTGATLLGASGYLVEARLPGAILLIGFSVMLLLITVNYIGNTKEKHHKGIALISGLLACAVFASGIFKALQPDPLVESKQALHRAAIEMFSDNPIFGWGVDSFQQLAPFYLDDSLLGARYDRVTSDALQLLAEVGIVGTAVTVLILALLMFHYIRRKLDVRTTNHLLIGCIGVVVMAFFDTPLMSPAVFLSLFVVFFSALRWAVVSRNKVDEVDAAARPNLVTAEAERNVPFFTGEYDETEK
jgi:O-antigen ligase